MNGKISKNNIKTFFTYDLLKVLAVCVAFCLVFSLLFGVVEKKVEEGQRFTIMYGDDVLVGDEVNDVYSELFSEENENSFSYNVLNFETKQIVAINQSPQYLMNTYSGMHDDDVFICTVTLIENYVETYKAQDLNAYITGAFNYLYDNNFYDENGVINEDAIIANFSKKNKNNSNFKNDGVFEKAKLSEIKRIKAIFENATILKGVFENNPQIFDDEYNVLPDTGYKGNFAIKLSELKGGELLIENSFKREVKKEESAVVSYTVEGVYLLLGNKSSINGDMHYEGLTFLVNFLKKYSNLIQ